MIVSASFYFTGPILIKRNIYTVMFKFNLIKSTVRVRVKVRVFAGVFYRIY